MNHVLFHVSESEGITCFEPRPTRPRPGAPSGDVVWAIDAAHLHMYLLPRNCPRLTFFAKADTSLEDRLRFLSSTVARHIVAIESAWLERTMAHRLYAYELPAGTFELEDAVAGRYISRQAVVPCGVQVIDHPLAYLVRCDVELRVMPSLWELRDQVIGSSLDFSIIRMRNAAPPMNGYVPKYPLS